MFHNVVTGIFQGRAIVLIAVLAIILSASAAHSAVPQIISYQGSLTDGSGQLVPDGNYLIKFKIYSDPAAADSLWSSGYRNVAVANGSFIYLLGSQVPFPTHLFDTDTIRYLGVTVSPGTELAPRIRFATVPYAYKALAADSSGYALTVADNSISNSKLTPNAVTSGNIANSTITDADISGSAAIEPSKINGTAMILSSGSLQSVSGFVEFTGPVIMYDSVLRSSQYGIKIGSAVAHSSTGGLLEVTRTYNATGTRYGMKAALDNSSTGALYGIHSEVEHVTAGAGGTAVGVYGHAISDGSSRNGIYALAEAQNSALTTGTSYGVSGAAYDGANAYGIYGYAASATTNYAGYFNGNVQATGVVIKAGGTFRIDHPLDPENKYLQHSFVESPDMMNVYNGNIKLDEQGEAVVVLPVWFGALNREFRYQLTAIGAPGPNLYIADEIKENHFRIAGGKDGMTVSWQVTGIRQDPWAEANRIQVELDKNPDELGKYMHPEVYNQPVEKSVDYESLRPILEARGDRH